MRPHWTFDPSLCSLTTQQPLVVIVEIMSRLLRGFKVVSSSVSDLTGGNFQYALMARTLTLDNSQAHGGKVGLFHSAAPMFLSNDPPGFIPARHTLTFSVIHISRANPSL